MGKKKKRNKTTTEKAAETAIRKIAEREGVSTEYVRKQMQVAMLNGLCSTDPKIKAFWDAVPRDKEVPTPEEFITYISLKIKRKGL